jgi:membrane associated rhomboid family serine protease
MYFSTIRILIYVSAICYLLQSIYYPIIDKNFGLSYIGNDNFDTIQLFTYGFLHGSPFHLLVNLFMLVLFGSKIDMVFGCKQFLIILFLSIIGGGIFQTISNMLIVNNHFGTPFPLDSTTDAVGNVLFALENGMYMRSVFSSITIGMSGGVFGCMLAYTTLFPNDKFNVIFTSWEIPCRWFVVAYIGLEIYNAFHAQDIQIAHFAHLGGAVFGFLYALKLRLHFSI